MNSRRNVDSFGVSRSMHFAFGNFASYLENLILFIEFLNLNYNDNNSWKKSLVMGFMNLYVFLGDFSCWFGCKKFYVCVCVSMFKSSDPFFDGIWNVLDFAPKMVKFLAFQKSNGRPIRNYIEVVVHNVRRTHSKIATNFWPRYYQHGYRRILNI